MSTFRLRKISDVQSFLGTLMGREIHATAGAPMQMDVGDVFMVGVYAFEKKSVVGALVIDLPLAASLGAALTMITPASVRSTVLTGKIGESMWDNLFEVFNISCQFFGGDRKGEVELHKVYRHPETLPLKVLQYLKNAKFRMNIDAEVEGYGPGQMGLFA